ncbi:MAG: DUF3846 domain-containing protein [Aristaeellaceae bacterium]
MSTISVMVKAPGIGRSWTPWQCQRVENKLEAFQALVGGHIETVPVSETMVLLVNDEGKINGMEANFPYRGDLLCGTVVAVGVRGDEFASCPARSNADMMRVLLEDE